MTLYEMGVQPHLRAPGRVSKAEVLRQLAEFEVAQEMSSEEFLSRWRAGQLPEQAPYVEWYRLSTILAHLP